MKNMLVIMAIFVALVSVVWLGLQIRPQSFPTFASKSFDVKAIPLPKDLPAPVALFYRQLHGEDVPVVQSAVISGRGQLRIKGITFPARFRFTHRTGEDYRHYIETTLFGFPIMKVNEHFLDGKSRLELPFGVSEGPKVDQGANLALWAEAVWMPSVWITDSHVRWEARDDHSAFLIVPFKETEERFTVSFDPQTGLLKFLESMRHKEADSAEKTLWKNEVLEWRELDGYMIPVETAVTWTDEGSPWAVFTTEDVIYNVDVDKYIRMKGPGE